MRTVIFTSLGPSFTCVSPSSLCVSLCLARDLSPPSASPQTSPCFCACLCVSSPSQECPEGQGEEDWGYGALSSYCGFLLKAWMEGERKLISSWFPNCLTVTTVVCLLVYDPYLVDSETGEDTDAFFSFFPEPWPLVPLLCFGDPLDFLDEGDSLFLSGSGEA